MFMKDLQTSMSTFSFPYSALLKQRHCLKKNTGTKCSSSFQHQFCIIPSSIDPRNQIQFIPLFLITANLCISLCINRILLSNSLSSFPRIRWAIRAIRSTFPPYQSTLTCACTCMVFGYFYVQPLPHYHVLSFNIPRQIINSMPPWSIEAFFCNHGVGVW